MKFLREIGTWSLASIFLPSVPSNGGTKFGSYFREVSTRTP